MAVVAMEIDQYKRLAALEELHGRKDAWSRAEAEENAKLREMYQKAIDAPRLKAMWERVKAAGEEIKKDAAQIERNELIRRGVLRGRRG